MSKQPGAGTKKVQAKRPMKVGQTRSLGERIRENWQLYLMLLVPVVLTIVYKYIPMWGIQIAFRDYKAARGVMGSNWVGMKWFT